MDIRAITGGTPPRKETKECRHTDDLELALSLVNKLTGDNKGRVIALCKALLSQQRPLICSQESVR